MFLYLYPMRTCFIRRAILLAFAGLALSMQVSSAQRTSVGTPFAGVSAVSSFTGSGCQVEFGQYKLGGFWKGTLSGVNRGLSLEDGSGRAVGTVPYLHVDFDAEYLWRLYGSRARKVNLYGGGGVFLGYESIDPYGRTPKGVALPYETRTAFLYGVSATAEVEWFFLSRLVPCLAAVGGGRMPVNFSSLVSNLSCEVYLGLRYDF